jgi:hypothetical protein
MRLLDPPREIPRRPDGTPNPIYFELTAGGHTRWFRMPNDRVLMELMTLLASLSGAERGNGLQFDGAIGVLAAMVGASWWDPTMEIEAETPSTGGDWIAYGDAVIEELHECGMAAYSFVAPVAGELAKKFGAVLLGTEQTLDFGAAQEEQASLT